MSGINPVSLYKLYQLSEEAKKNGGQSIETQQKAAELAQEFVINSTETPGASTDEQLASTHDAQRKSTVSQLGHAVQAYKVQNGRMLPVSSTWMSDLVSAGELADEPTPIDEKRKLVCEKTGISDAGFCYNSSSNEGIVYTFIESQTEQNKCNGKVAWYVYSTSQGRSGTVCTTPSFYPQVEEQVFVE